MITPSSDFSPLAPLRCWADVLLSGIKPDQVKLIGINGGNIAAFEYQLATALGATVAVIQGSGRKADEILQDPEWAEEENLAGVPFDFMTLKVFLSPKPPKHKDREIMARAAHQFYLKDQIDNLAKKTWEDLSEDLKESNRAQVDDIARKLSHLGYRIEPIPESETDAEVPTFEKDDDIEYLADMEHGRWNVERLFSGWKYAEEKDVQNKRSPYLIRWDKLDEDVKQWDRNSVTNIPYILKQAKLRIRK